MLSLVQVALGSKLDISARQRRASESDTMIDKADNLTQNLLKKGAKNVDILQMLSKAQDEYDKVEILF